MLLYLISILFFRTFPSIYNNFFKELPSLRFLSILLRRSFYLHFLLSLSCAALLWFREVANDENAMLAILH